MVENDTQLCITKNQLENLDNEISRFWASDNNKRKDPIIAESELRGLFSMYDTLSEQIREYKKGSYIKDVIRSESHVFSCASRELERLLHAAIGLATEAGELLDIIKRAIFYDEEINVDHIKEELGDNQWYVALALSVLSSSFEEIQAMNIAKLKTRYPEKFIEENALNRNLEKEKEALKGKKHV